MYYPNWDTEYDNSGITPTPTPTDTLWRQDSNILKPIDSNAVVQMNRFGTKSNNVISNIITSTDTQGILSDNQLLTAAKTESLVKSINTSPFEYVSESIPINTTQTTLTGTVKYTDKIPQEDTNNTLFSVGPIHCSDVIQIEDSKIGPPITEYWNTENGLYTKHVTTDHIQTQNIGVNGDTRTTTLTLPSYDTINNVIIGDIQTLPNELNPISLPSTNYVKNEISESVSEITSNIPFNESNKKITPKDASAVLSIGNVPNAASTDNAISNLRTTSLDIQSNIDNFGYISMSSKIDNSGTADESMNTTIELNSNPTNEDYGAYSNIRMFKDTTRYFNIQHHTHRVLDKFEDYATLEFNTNNMSKPCYISFNAQGIGFGGVPISVDKLSVGNDTVITDIRQSNNVDDPEDSYLGTVAYTKQLMSSSGNVSGMIVRSNQTLDSSTYTYLNSYFKWINPLADNLQYGLSVSWMMQPDGVHLLFRISMVGNTYINTFTEVFHNSDIFNPLKLFPLTTSLGNNLVCLSGDVMVINPSDNTDGYTVELMTTTDYYQAQLRIGYGSGKCYGNVITKTGLPTGFSGYHSFHLLIQNDNPTTTGLFFPENMISDFKQTYKNSEIVCEYRVK